VTNFEKINARSLDEVKLPREVFDVVVMDLSFISLTKVLLPAWARVARGGWLVALIKPQFEAEKAEVDKGRGIIRDVAVHERVKASVLAFIEGNFGSRGFVGVMDSPIEGGDGNREFLVAVGKEC
jgi:23S rRNA (cytidine1920-2'-O)/16S rRNA (cytidine1409-2'-O)-methyltransferase